MLLKEIIEVIESNAPLAFQENYDNAGLIYGEPDWNINSALITLDITEEVIDEAIQKKTGLIISHHPLIFSGLKKIRNRGYVERSIIKAIKNDIAIYSAHTNLDNASNGLNIKIGDILGLNKLKILSPFKDFLFKLVVFVPVEYEDKVREAIFNAGAGHIGNYDQCSYNLSGKGSFRGLEGTNPFIGTKGTLHFEKETRIETIMPKHLINRIVKALIESHPYKEPAYDIYPVQNQFSKAGMGIIGELKEPMKEIPFLKMVKKKYNTPILKHTSLLNKNIKTVALCGGTGTQLIGEAKKQGADVFISSDFKYHQFFEGEKQILIIDVGHYESEQFSKQLFYDMIHKKFPNFAIHFSKTNTNPVKYF